MDNKDFIIIHGAKEHNLKNIDLKLPRNKLVVITGLSGSGKSSLAFDTLYAEGQRRYVESLSAYARQFLEQLQKPDVEYIEGLSPAISIEQRSASSNPRSTVATQTELYDYLRLLFARIGRPHCYKCKREIAQQSSSEIVNQVLKLPKNKELQILAPIVRGKKGEHQWVFTHLKKNGFVRARVDGRVYDLDEKIELSKNKKHYIEAVVDRLTLDGDIKSRLGDSIETALKVGKGIVAVNELIFSEIYACVNCGISLEELSPRMFSFNSPYGACKECDGLGTRLEIDPELVIPDKGRLLSEGAIEPWRRGGMQMMWYYNRLLKELAAHYRFSLETPFIALDDRLRDIILYGCDEEIWGGAFEGVIPNLERRFRETESDTVKDQISQYMSMLPCPKCKGARLNEASLSVTIEERNIHQVTTMSVAEAKRFFETLCLSSKEKDIAYQVLKEIKARLNFMINVGLDYLTLDRRSSTLSGGEAQRIRLATQVGSGLVGVLYILDEPSIGLHQRDNVKLLDTLKKLRDLGNTLIVVEHDESTICSADYIVDLGPGAGKHGGEVVAAGRLDDILKNPASLTGRYLRGKNFIPIPKKRRSYKDKQRLIIKGAKEHNLKGINVNIPLGVFTCVTGVSGSGKSTLVDEILYRGLAQRLYLAREKPGRHDSITGASYIDKVIVIDQSPIGRTPRSNPATYTGVFTYIRELFALTPLSKMRGYKPGRFSFNVKGGRCEACQGDGIKKIEMHFLPDVYVTCEACKGKRFNEQTLEVTYRGKSISDVLDMTVEEGLELFSNIPKIKEKLMTIFNVGLGYIELGQSATTLSGGEAQRVKLSTELSKRATGRTLYILDEPTTGLHFADVDKLLKVLHLLVDAGNTVVVIEHNMEVIKTADYIIDLGPEGGDKGGLIVAEGTPEEVSQQSLSYTGQFLKKVLNKVLKTDKIKQK